MPNEPHIPQDDQAAVVPGTRPLRYIRKFFNALILLVLSSFLLLQLPIVQRYIAEQVTTSVSSILQAPVSLEYVRFSWFDKLRIEQLYVGDVYGDTLLSAGSLYADFNLNPFVLFSRGLEVEAVSLEDAQFNIRRNVGDPESNLEIALERLFPNNPDRSQKPFQMNLRDVSLARVHFVQRDSVRGQEMNVFLESAVAQLDQLNIPDKIIDVAKTSITRPFISITNFDASPLGVDSSTVVLLDSLAKNLDDTINLQIRVDDFQIYEGHFKLTNYRKEPERLGPADQLNWSHLDVFDINVDIDSFAFVRDTFQGRVNGIALREKAGFQLDKLAVQQAMVSSNGIALNGLELQTPYSDLGDTLRMRYRGYAAFNTFDDDVKLDLRLNNATIALRDIMTFAPKLRDNRFFLNNRETALQIEGQISQQINNLRGRDLVLRLPDGTYLKGNFSTRDLARRGEEVLNLRLDELRTSVPTLRDLIPNFRPPSNFDRLGVLNFSGRFDGFLTDFVANGELNTALGSASMDMRMNLKPGVRLANYSGKLLLDNFDLAKWTQNNDFGIVNVSTEVKNGTGLVSETAQAELTAQIADFPFRGYTYKNATLTGQLNRNFFNGNFSIQDDNIDLSFAGELDFTDSIPQFDFAARVAKLELQALNLSEADLALAGEVDINLRNTRISDMTGNLLVRDLVLVKDRTDRYEIDSLSATSYFEEDGTKRFLVDSDIGRVSVTGLFDIDELPGSFKQFLVRNYPGFAGRLNINPPRTVLEGNQFSYDIFISDSKGINWLIDPKLGPIQGASLRGSYDGIRDSLDLDLDLPSLTYGDMKLIDLAVKVDAVQNEGELEVGVDSTFIKDKFWFNQITLLSLLEGDSIDFNVNYMSDKPSLLDELNLNGYFYLPDSTNYRVKFRQSNLFLLSTPWFIDEDNTITFGKNYFDIRDFALSNRNRRILLEKTGEESLRLDLQRFNFKFIDELWDYKELDFAGRFDAVVSIEDVFNLKNISAEVKADTFLINNDNYGTFQLNASVPDLKNTVEVAVKIQKDTAQLTVDGTFNLADLAAPPRNGNLPLVQRKNYMDAQIDIRSFPLSLSEYWIGQSVSNVVGRFGGELRLYGMPDRPDVSGFINARNGAFSIDYLKTRYSFDQGFISAGNFLFDATGTVIRDRLGNTARIIGGISHNHLKDLGLSAELKTERFLALDTKKGDNSQFYGVAIGKGDVRFSGSFKQTDIYVNASVGAGSKLTIPVSNERDASNLNLIRFVDKHKKNETTVLDQTSELKGLSLEMDLNIREEASVEMIFDEQVGDIIRGSGRGDIRILLPRNGEFQMFGQYEIEEGNYLFTLYNVVNKDFRIKRGGQVNWTGDPFGARIQLEAEYKDLKASVAPFIQEYLVNANPGLRSLAASATDVDLILKLEGDLLKPNIDFDLTFPNLNGQLESFAENKLRLVKQDQNELNRQVFGLIVVGQFLPSDLAINGAELATNTLSELLNNQLSLLVTQLVSEWAGDDNVFSNLNLDIAYNTYSQVNIGDGQDIGKEREFQLTLQKNFLNDRLSVQVGGNVDFGRSFNTAPGTNGAFVGNDLVIEYILNQNRTLKLRLYQRLEPDIAGGSRLEIGTGLSYRREFDSFGEFWKSFKKNTQDKR